MAQLSRSVKETLDRPHKWQQVTKWLPNEVNDGKVHYRLDDDVSTWTNYYQRIGRSFEVRTRGCQKAVFIEVG